jgi:predicted DNA binding CopG/RHH family protein
MNTRLKNKPAFRTEDEEREFWANHSPLDYFNTAPVKRTSFPNLRPTLRSISIRLPVDMLDALKVLANKRDVPYQSLAKLYLAWGIKAERRTHQTESRPNNTTERITRPRRSGKHLP